MSVATAQTSVQERFVSHRSSLRLEVDAVLPLHANILTAGLSKSKFSFLNLTLVAQYFPLPIQPNTRCDAAVSGEALLGCRTMNRLTSFDARPSAITASVACWASSVPFVSRLWRELLKEMLCPYRPELHYMRGPGPRYREKNGAEYKLAKAN